MSSEVVQAHRISRLDRSTAPFRRPSILLECLAVVRKMPRTRFFRRHSLRLGHFQILTPQGSSATMTAGLRPL